MALMCLHHNRVCGLVLIGVLGLMAGCTHTVKVEPIKVEPIDITLHIYLQADQKLDDFFGDDEAGTGSADEKEGGGR